MPGIMLRRKANAPDRTPDAVDWTTLSGSGVVTGNSQTITGLGPGISITLQVSWVDSQDILSPSYKKNGAGAVGIGQFGTISVANGDTIQWVGQNTGSPGFGITSGTFTVTNSTMGVQLDTFTYSIT